MKEFGHRPAGPTSLRCSKQTSICPHPLRQFVDRCLEASGRSQAPGFGQVEASLPIYGDPVVTARLVRGYQTIECIVEHPLGVTRARVAEATAPWQAEADCIACRHSLTTLWANRLAGTKRDRAICARLAPLAASCGVADTLKIAKQRDRRNARPAQLDDLSKSPTKLARTAGALTKFAAIEHNGSHAFGCLDRNCAHARRKRRSAESVFAWPRAGPTAVEDHGAEGGQRVCIDALFDLIDQ